MGNNVIYSYCRYSRTIKDCGGNIVVICGFTDKCPYRNVVRNYDGDWMEICTQ